MRIKSIIDVITNSSSEVYVIKDSSIENINQTLSKLGVSGIGKVIKFDLSRYRDWQKGKLSESSWDEEHYYKNLWAFLDLEDLKSIKEAYRRYIVYEEPEWETTKYGSATGISGDLDKYQKDYKRSRLDFDSWYEKNKNNLPGVEYVLGHTVYQITLQDMDGLYMTGSVEENSVTPEDINKIINNLNATRYFI